MFAGFSITIHTKLSVSGETRRPRNNLAHSAIVVLDDVESFFALWHGTKGYI